MNWLRLIQLLGNMVNLKILALVVCGFYSVESQTLSISATLQDDPEASGISIQILYEDGGTLADFCITSKSTDCVFEDLGTGEYEVRVKFFGYKDSSQVIALDKNSELKLVFILRPISYNLPNVSVIDKIIGMKRRGDTLQYNLKAYTSGTEQNLGDIINQLPGMELDENGNVLVRNKKADALLIEGRELVNDQHKLATEGMQSGLVDYIELIENYKKEKEQFVGEQENNKVAVNVRLKEDAKGSFTGNAQLLAGPTRFLRSALNVFRSTASSGYSFYFRQNNTGEQGLERPFYLLLENFSGKEGWNNLMRIESMPNSLSMDMATALPQGLVQNEDYHFALNADNDWGTKINNRLYFTGSLADRVSETRVVRRYFDQGTTEQLDRNAKQNLPYLFARNETVFEWGDGHFTELILPMSWRDAIMTERDVGSFDQSSFNQRSEQQQRYFVFQPQLEHSYKIKKDLILTGLQNMELLNHSSKIDLKAQDAFLGLSGPDSAGHYDIGQSVSYKKWQSKSALELRKNQGKSYLRYRAQFGLQKEQLTAEATQRISGPIAGEETLQSAYFQHALNGRKDFGNGRFALTLNHAWLNQTFKEVSETSDHYLLPYAIFVYEYASKHAFSLSFGQSLEFPNLMNTYILNRLMGPRLLASGNLDLETLRRTTTYNISFFAPPQSGPSILYNVQFSFNQLKKSFVTNSQVKENFVQNEFIQSPTINQYLASAYASKFFNRWSVRWQSRTSYEQGFGSRAGLLRPLSKLQFSNSLRLQSKRWKNWTLSVSMNYNYMQQSFESTLREFNNWQVEIDAGFTIRKWVLNTSVAYNTQSSTLENNDLWLLDVNIQYNLNRKWRFFLEGNNLLNLQSADVLQAGFQENFSEIERFQTFPGQVLLGVGYYF